MKLKIILSGLFVFCTLAPAGFFDNDKPYYDKHPKEAEAKFKECDKAIAHAMIDQDKEKYNEILNDVECKAAKQSYKEHKQKIRQVKYEAEKKRRAEEKAKKDAQYKIDYEEQIELQKKIPYEDFVKINKSCGLSFGRPTAECKVHGELKHMRKEQSVKELMTKYQGDALRAYKKKACDKEGTFGPNCDVSLEAVKRDYEGTVAMLTSDKEAFKKVYNECAKIIMPLRKKMKWEKINETIITFKCSTALEASRRTYDAGAFVKLIK